MWIGIGSKTAHPQYQPILHQTMAAALALQPKYKALFHPYIPEDILEDCSHCADPNIYYFLVTPIQSNYQAP